MTEQFDLAASQSLRDHYEATQRQRTSVHLLEAISEWARYWELDLSHAQVSLGRWVHGLDTVPVVEFYVHAHTATDYKLVARACVDKRYACAPIEAYPDRRGEAVGTDRLGVMHSFWVRWLGIEELEGKVGRWLDGTEFTDLQPEVPLTRP